MAALSAPGPGKSPSSGIGRGLGFPVLILRQSYVEGVELLRLTLEIQQQHVPRGLASNQSVVERAVHVLGVNLIGDQKEDRDPTQGREQSYALDPTLGGGLLYVVFLAAGHRSVAIPEI